MNTANYMDNRSHDFKTLTYAEFVEFFCHLLFEEIHFRQKNNLEYSYLKKKYQNNFFSENGTVIPITTRGYAERLMLLMQQIKRIKGEVTLLDVGCGCGSEALLLSLLGVKVVGVDVVPDRIKFARSRIGYYQQFSKDLLSIQFVNSDVFRYLASSDRFNIIWMIEAISHVHPAEEFIQLAFERLHDNGFLIISDSNALNPVSCYRSARMRGSLRWYSSSANYGEPVEIAQERIFSVFSMERKLKKAGFKIEYMDISGFMGSYILPQKILESKCISNIMISFQNTMKKIPILRLLGSNFTVIAAK